MCEEKETKIPFIPYFWRGSFIFCFRCLNKIACVTTGGTLFTLILDETYFVMLKYDHSKGILNSNKFQRKQLSYQSAVYLRPPTNLSTACVFFYTNTNKRIFIYENPNLVFVLTLNEFGDCSFPFSSIEFMLVHEFAFTWGHLITEKSEDKWFQPHWTWSLQIIKSDFIAFVSIWAIKRNTFSVSLFLCDQYYMTSIIFKRATRCNILRSAQ